MSTDTMPRRYRVGDHVRLHEHAGGRSWLIVGDDTGQTPVVDHEPAYRLANGKNRRSAYESDLVLVSRIEAAGASRLA